jgi:hypothetical protein
LLCAPNWHPVWRTFPAAQPREAVAEFLADIAAARAKYAEKSGQTTAVPAVNASQPSTARIYRIDGTPVSNTTHGIVIEDGQKKLLP